MKTFPLVISSPLFPLLFPPETCVFHLRLSDLVLEFAFLFVVVVL